MDIRDLTKEIKSSILCFPADDFNMMTNKVCLSSFHDFIIDNSDFSIEEATQICELIRVYVAYNKSFYIDEHSCIRFKLNTKVRVIK